VRRSLAFQPAGEDRTGGRSLRRHHLFDGLAEAGADDRYACAGGAQRAQEITEAGRQLGGGTI